MYCLNCIHYDFSSGTPYLIIPSISPKIYYSLTIGSEISDIILELYSDVNIDCIQSIVTPDVGTFMELSALLTSTISFCTTCSNSSPMELLKSIQLEIQKPGYSIALKDAHSLRTSLQSLISLRTLQNHK